MCGHVPWFHSAVLFYSPGRVFFHFSITAFVMTEFFKYKGRIIVTTPPPQILGSHYFIIVLPSVFLSLHPSMSGEVWILPGRLWFSMRCVCLWWMSLEMEGVVCNTPLPHWQGHLHWGHLLAPDCVIWHQTWTTHTSASHLILSPPPPHLSSAYWSC